MEKKGVIIAANFGLDPALALALITAHMAQVRGIHFQGNYSEEGSQPPLFHYFIPEDYICEDLEQIIKNQELLILVGYPKEPQLLNLINKLSEKLAVMFVDNRCATYLVSNMIKGQVESDYLLAAAKWCGYNGIELRPKVLAACQGDETTANEIIKRYEAAWVTVFNLDMKDLQEQARFHLAFVDEIIYGDTSDYIEKILRLKEKMTRETHKLTQQVRDLGYGIGLIKTGSKPFFKAQALTNIQGGFLVKVVEYIKKEKIEHLIFYDLKTAAIKMNDVQTKDGPFELGVIGQN